MARARAPQRTDRDVVGAGAAGGGLGTVIATMADRLPPTSDYKSLLTVAAPLAAVAISWLCLFVKAVYIDPYAEAVKNKNADATMEKMLADAREHLTRVEADQSSSTEHRARVRKMVEELEKARLDKITERMEVVVAR
jgi:hypothetical protein